MKRCSDGDISQYDRVNYKKVKEGNEPQNEKSDLNHFIKNKDMIELLNKKGIKKLFPIQYETFETIYKGKDIIARDRTGSGKTLAYALPIIEKMRSKQLFEGRKLPKFLILLPTRQLAIQVTNQIKSLKLKNDFQILTVYGGSDINQQIRRIQSGVDIIASTPGRLLDLLERQVIQLNKLEVTCLDEADQMLKLGFQQAVEKIFEYIQKYAGKKTQNLLFSATIPSWLIQISSKYLSPQHTNIDLIKDSDVKTSKTVQHLSLCCSSYEYKQLIPKVINHYAGSQGKVIVFCETKRQVNEIGCEINSNKDVQILHGDIPQKKRQYTFQNFKHGRIRCLVATNVAARGLDFPQVDLIIQLQPPKDIDSYIHRSGRTGRAGKSGICVTLHSKDNDFQMKKIQRAAKINFKRIQAPQDYTMKPRNDRREDKQENQERKYNRDYSDNERKGFYTKHKKG